MSSRWQKLDLAIWRESVSCKPCSQTVPMDEFFLPKATCRATARQTRRHSIVTTSAPHARIYMSQASWIRAFLAGLLLKTGAYGMIRFIVPLFPGAAQGFGPVAMTLGVVGILYGAVLALGRADLKRLVAYTSVSHLGFVLLGIFAWNDWALQGALMG